MTKKMQEPANTNMPMRQLDDSELDAATGGAETVHLELKANGTTLDGQSTNAKKVREIVVVGSKIKEPVRN